MTNGGRARLVLALVVPVTLAFAIVNSLTVSDDLAGIAQGPDAWEPWVWELTSAAFWIAAAVPLVALLRLFRPPQFGWPAAAALVALVSVPVCAAHVAWLAASRAAIYAALDTAYRYDWTRAQMIYEWRKDLLSVLAFAVIGYAIDRVTAAPLAPAVIEPEPPFRLEIRDGTRVLWLTPGEIERIEAAGNYVEVHAVSGPVLHRATLAAVEEQLSPHGFVRIHRSRLVRRAAVKGITATPAGDFEAVLASGATVAGSRRFRSALG